MSSIGGVVLSLLCHHGWSDTGGCMDGSSGLEILSLFSGLNNMKAALVGSEQAVGTCLRVHVHS